MLTDTMLKEAAAEAERHLLSIVPEDGEPHVFSKRFERKMDKLIRRANHPIRYKVMRAAAAAVLAIVTLFGAVMAVSPEVRAAVVGWIKETFGVYAHYSSDSNNTADSKNDQTKYEYHLSAIPEGYRELKVVERPDGKTYLYIDDSGNLLQFTYTYGAENSSLFVKTEDYEQHANFVNNLPADIYIAREENETSVIVWQDLNADILFQITAMEDQTKLIEIAETVARIEQE